MLMLSRKIGEKLVVVVPPSTTTTVIELLVAEAHAGRARIGTEAPAGVLVDREEIHLRRMADRAAANGGRS